MYKGLSTRHDWPAKNPIVDLPMILKRYSKRISGNSLSLLGLRTRISTFLLRADVSNRG